MLFTRGDLSFETINYTLISERSTPNSTFSIVYVHDKSSIIIYFSESIYITYI